MDEVIKAKRQQPAGSSSRVIAIRGAREHNLKNIDLDIPRDQLVVFTGLSGSGKSSLAFDTIYAEGQRRYVESLSAYARQFLEMMQKPDVDQIDGLSPAISIEQKTTSRNPRSTVGTVTEIYDYMRLLWARVGVPYSPATGLPIESQTVSQMVDRVLALPEGTRLYLLAPVVRGRKGEYRKELAEFIKKGYQRVKIDGKFYEIARGAGARQEVQARHRRGGRPHRGARRTSRTRLADSLETGAEARRRHGGGRVRRRRAVDAAPRPTSSATRPPSASIFSEKFACPVSGFTIPEIEPRLFSFNNPFGACPECGGLGVEQHIDADLVIPDKDAHACARAPSRRGRNRRRPTTCRRWRRSASTTSSRSTPSGRTCRRRRRTRSSTAPATTRSRFTYDDGMRSYETKKPFEGVITNLERRCKETESDWAREEIAQLLHRHALRGLQRLSASSPRRCASRSAASTSARSPRCRSKRAGEWFTELPAAAHRQAERDRRAACSRKSASG